MKAHKAWSYRPYRPPFIEVGHPYICRVAPSPTSIHLEWLRENAETAEIYARPRNSGDFALVGTTDGTEYTITGLTSGTEYEFYVRTGEILSRTRLALCGEAVDTVVNYLHPEDEAYAFSGRYLCSPSLVRHPEGFLLASMDLYAGAHPQNLTLIFRSDDDGQSWHYVSELFPCFWGKLFVHEGAVYMLACSTEYGDLLIGRSDDGGVTFTEPTVLLRGGGGKNGEAGVHKNPQPVLMHDGRIWNTLEWGAWARGYHAVMVMSAPVDADLLDADVWDFSEPLPYDPAWPGLPEGESAGNIEGALMVQDGQLYNLMRYDMTRMTPNFGKILAYRVDTAHPEAPIIFDHTVDFPANHSKFMIKRDERTGRWYSIASRITDSRFPYARNRLSLLASDDLLHWEVDRDIFDYSHASPDKVGFQYVDFLIEGGRILYLCRTALNGAANFHDANYSIFGTLTLS